MTLASDVHAFIDRWYPHYGRTTPMGNGKVEPRKGPGFDEDSLRNAFTFHPPRDDREKAQHETIRDAGLTLADLILQLTPGCPEQTLAIQRVREAVMWANAALACHRE